MSRGIAWALGALLLAVCIAVVLHTRSAPQTHEPRVVAVLGATGAQGGALVATLHADPRFRVRVLTRGLRAPLPAGVEMVVGDMHDDASVAELLRGAWGLFLVTFTDFHGQGELDVGRRIAERARAAGVQHIVFSSGVRTGVAFMDVKADIEQHIRGLHFPRALYLRSGFFYENLVVKGGQPRVRCEPASLAASENSSSPLSAPPSASSDTAAASPPPSAAIPSPSTPSSSLHPAPGPSNPPATVVTFYSPMPADIRVAMHSAADIGRLAALSFRDEQAFAHEAGVRVVGDYLSAAEFVAAFDGVAATHAASITGRYSAIPIDQLPQMIPGPAGQRIAEMYRWFIGGGMAHLDTDIEQQIQAVPEARSVHRWLDEEGLAVVVSTCRLFREEEEQ